MAPEPATAARTSSRGSSPLPSRPSTPPPPLPPPSLKDLGLTLASITSHLSPSHFSSPPTSGAFLAPNYLLLCHAQGLDVLPLANPPSTQPYTLIRRVPFKSVVVMEHRGVLVAIAGRRDGVRVYALEEVKRAIEWRMEVEIRREREKARREEAKKATAANAEAHKRAMSEKAKLFPSSNSNDKLVRRSSISVVPSSPAATPRTPPRPPAPPIPAGPPPAYSPTIRGREPSSLNLNATVSRARTTSVNDVLAGTARRRPTSEDTERDVHDDTKPDWVSSDDEAINPVAAPSGSQALDERTSAAASGSASAHAVASTSGARLEVPRTQTSSSIHNRRHRPSNLDLSMLRPNGNVATSPTAPPSPTPTLLTLRQALLASPGSTPALPARHTLSRQNTNETPEPDGEADEDEDADADPPPSSPTTPTRERISLADALFESRLPNLPPVGTRQPQEAILLSSVASGDEDPTASPRTSDTHSTYTRRSTGDQSNRRRRRWSVLDGIFTPSSAHASQSSIPSVPETSMPSQANAVHTDTETRERTLSRSQSTRAVSSLPQSAPRAPSNGRPATADGHTITSTVTVPPVPTPAPSVSSRFIPRILTNAFYNRRNDDRPPTPNTADSDSRRNLTTPMAPHAPAPKLEYVKLPGTKGSVMIKAVETAKKSFLAILCGENGEKVELFAGTYRTALGLSRTFILPDSPRSLELQLQGDDLVEVFLVFSQNVFGLEPATVRVREVRIGRAERRAARRRARENRTTDPNDPAEPADGDTMPGEEETSVNVSIGVAVTPAPPTGMEEGPPAQSPLPSPSPSGSTLPLQSGETPTGNAEAASATDELITLATAQMSPYSTFQQLHFAPKFPLATIADDYVIPPTYPSFIGYRNQYEPEVNGSNNVDLSQVQFSPPGLPVPTSSPPSKWYYRDPKGVVHGPWKTSLMQAWYQDGLLPPELPVRREEDTEYTLLKDLRSQCLDPTHPFRSSPPPPTQSLAHAVPLPLDASKPLLRPLSLLAQPKHFGPPALFYSSRGGHSTTIVDARGRSVLKGRFLWSADADDDLNTSFPRLGDVKRLEAFDVNDRAVLVAMRQGGLEVVDFGDALLKPADYSRTLFPHFHPPLSSINRRGAFVWKIGAPISSTSSPSAVFGLPSKFPAHRLQPKKQSTGPTKSPGRTDFSLGGGDRDADGESQDEVLFLGRKDDELYLCERRAGSFRILCLSPSSSSELQTPSLPVRALDDHRIHSL
ncbi:unnamed protein product [Somion occarium]